LWEVFWPLFPAIVLAKGILQIKAYQLLLCNGGVWLISILAGAFFLLFYGVKLSPRQKQKMPGKKHMRDLWAALWPIAIVIFLFAAFNLTPAAGAFVAVVMFSFVHKFGFKRVIWYLRSTLKDELVVLIFAALFYKLVLQSSGAVSEVVGFFDSINLHPYIVIFLLPFMVGYLTGITSAAVAIAFPFITAYTGTGADIQLNMVLLAFTGVLSSFLMTPVHLCLVLSAGYFETTIFKILRIILPAVVVTAAGGIMLAVLL
jgi:hypothetical protein